MAKVEVEESDSLTITLIPGDSFYRKGNDDWNNELIELDREVRAELSESIVSATDAKGDLITGAVLVHILAPALAGLFGVIKTWIQKNPGQRTLEMTWTEGSENKHFVITATNVDDNTLKAAVTEALKQRKR